MNLSDLFFGTDFFNRLGRKNIRGDELKTLLGVGNAGAFYSSLGSGTPPYTTAGGITTVTAGAPMPIIGGAGTTVGPQNGITGLGASVPLSFTVANAGDYDVTFSLVTVTGLAGLGDPGVTWDVNVRLNGATNVAIGTRFISGAAIGDLVRTVLTGTLTLAASDLVELIADPTVGAGVTLSLNTINARIVSLNA